MKKIIIFGIIIAVALLWFFIDRRSDIQEQLNKYKEEIRQQEERAKGNGQGTRDTTMNRRNDANPLVIFKTNKGDFSVELFVDRMPITAGNFLKLAKEDFYDGVKFHRVIPDFMIQGGDPNSKGDNMATYGTGGPGYTIKDEFVPGNANIRGTISMANSGPDTGGSQFFVNVVDNAGLNDKHPVFGEVVDGMGVVDAISKVQTGSRDVPVEPVVIKDIEVKE